MTVGSFEADREISRAPSRYADKVTESLKRLSAEYETTQKEDKRRQQRLAQELFGLGKLTEEQKDFVENHWEARSYLRVGKDKDGNYIFREKQAVYEKELKKVLSQHVLWPWLEQFPGLKGARTARIIAAIGDPWRFPGQPCTGMPDEKDRLTIHRFRPIYDIGFPCPWCSTEWERESEPGNGANGAGEADAYSESDGDAGLITCPGTMEPPRRGNGPRAVFHYFGLMPGQDGEHLVRKRKGSQASFSPKYRALVLGDDGTADQIIKQRTEPFRGIYDEVKERKLEDEYPRWRAHKIARICAAKEFMKLLILEWKERTPLEG